MFATTLPLMLPPCAAAIDDVMRINPMTDVGVNATRLKETPAGFIKRPGLIKPMKSIPLIICWFVSLWCFVSLWLVCLGIHLPQRLGENATLPCQLTILNPVRHFSRRTQPRLAIFLVV